MFTLSETLKDKTTPSNEHIIDAFLRITQKISQTYLVPFHSDGTVLL